MPFDRRPALLPLVDSAQLWVVLRSNRRERGTSPGEGF